LTITTSSGDGVFPSPPLCGGRGWRVRCAQCVHFRLALRRHIRHVQAAEAPRRLLIQPNRLPTCPDCDDRAGVNHPLDAGSGGSLQNIRRALDVDSPAMLPVVVEIDGPGEVEEE